MMRDRRIGMAVAACCLVTLVLAGCGPKNPLGRLAVSGTVNLQGKPLDQGSIELSTLEGSPKVSTGAAIKDGRFSISAPRGLPPGTYRVRISSADAGAGSAQPEFPGEHTAVARDRIPPEWNTKSDKQITVTRDGPNEFPFDIK